MTTISAVLAGYSLGTIFTLIIAALCRRFIK